MTRQLKRAAVAVALIFAGCCSNVVTLELITRHDASAAGTTVTFAQFAFVALAGLPSRVDWARRRLRPREIPLAQYALHVAMFFAVSVLNNAALGYRVPLPFHMIFRSGSLVTSLLLGALILGRRYSPAQVAAVVAVSAGIFLATTASLPAGQLLATLRGGFSGGGNSDFLIGIGMLTAALLLSSVMGVFQEFTYARFGRHLTQEHQFYSHFLTLPFFIGMVPDTVARLARWRSIAVATVPLVGGTQLQIPMLYVYLLLNVVTQWVCISGVYMMAGATGSLALTLTITLRKFVSLVISIIAFRNPFTSRHWLATALVFGGTLLYSLPSKKQPQPADPKGNGDPTKKAIKSD